MFELRVVLHPIRQPLDVAFQFYGVDESDEDIQLKPIQFTEIVAHE